MCLYAAILLKKRLMFPHTYFFSFNFERRERELPYLFKRYVENGTSSIEQSSEMKGSSYLSNHWHHAVNVNTHTISGYVLYKLTGFLCR